MPIDSRAFRNVLGHFTTGVTIVTAEVAGELFGMTANAFASVSLAPPLVLVSVARTAQLHPRIAEAGRFAISILGEEHESVSAHFAGRPDPMLALEWRRHASGTPVLAGALATIDCVLERAIDVGDHTLYIGAVQAADAREGAPLVYHKGRYRALSG